MKTGTVLVLGHDTNWALVDVLLSLGFCSLVRKNVYGAFDRLKYGQFAAIIVDRRFVNVDLLEFVLNVRDIRGEIPVVVIGHAYKAFDKASDEAFLCQNHTFVLKGGEDIDGLARELEQILADRGENNE